MYAVKENRLPLAERMIELGSDVNGRNKVKIKIKIQTWGYKDNEDVDMEYSEMVTGRKHLSQMCQSKSVILKCGI